MPPLRLPTEVETVFREVRTCEFTTVNKQGQPLTWPTLPYYNRPEGEFVVTTSIAFQVKAHNARRHPQVSLLFSDPIGSGLIDPPAVLVQGDSTVHETPGTTPLAVAVFRESVRRQPSARLYAGNPIARQLFLFYFQRIGIHVRAQRILVWPQRDFSRPPTELEVAYVE